MLKKFGITLLSLLLIPLTALASITFIALFLAVFALVSPYLALGGALYIAGKLSEKVIGWMYKEEINNPTINTEHSMGLASTLFQLLFTFLAYIPAAIGVVLATVVVTPLAILALPVVTAYLASEFLVDKVFKSTEPEYGLIPEPNFTHEDKIEFLESEESNTNEQEPANEPWIIERPYPFKPLSIYSKTFPFFKPEDILPSVKKVDLVEQEDIKPDFS